jgi:dihydrodipicolinate synthase/N-acetylneuraminate lyase
MVLRPFPGLTGVQATADELADLAARAPNFAGVKLSSPDLFLL